MANEETPRGFSGFTHIDDAGAELHPSVPEHAASLVHTGGAVAPDKQLEEVVVGPPAFGSPDPRTLGHVMNPAYDEPSSAPQLDDDYRKMVAARYAGTLEGDQLDEMSKDDLLNHAFNLGADVNKSMTKDELKQAISQHQESAGTTTEASVQNAPEAPEGAGVERGAADTATAGEQDETAPTGQPQELAGGQQANKDFSSMTKAELLQEAKAKGADVNESHSKQEIVDALKS